MTAIYTSSDLGKLVYQARKEQNLTQAELAASAGVGLRFIRELENGKETAQIGKILSVLSMLGLVPHIRGRSL